ncbi:HET-domain-containing protein [Glonium stellatum]|uniref:HET-domain-containing protein n=1 Tax=Glonium stellatum TaxID=574774 RepID=A0A8E2F4H1_9PEZI|nr:HET-domain-containing protein [Glonium stellatum]
MELARTWLSECFQNHQECLSDIRPDEPILPKRVIDIGPSDGSQEPYLFIPGSGSHRANYVALSHCWGPHQIITTTKGTIVAHQRRIEWAKLSKTFQDAVHVTRQFNIRYIWIDSLCIVQDSAEDWEMESAVMGDIYRNALFTISAAQAKDGADGCFSRRNSNVNRPCKMNLYFGQRPQDRATPKEDIGGEPQRSVYVYPFTSGNAVGPLYKRAWVYQEQALSTRTLAFGKDNVYWVCPSMNANENYPMGYRQRSSMPAAEFLRELKGSESEPDEFEMEEDLHDLWYGIIEEYSTRSLTKATDRLPAVSGLAAEINKRLEDDQYIAGLWREDLKRGLLWSCPDLRKTGLRAKPPLQYVAPSWSWASLAGRLISFSYAKQIFKYGDCVEDLEIQGVGRKLKGLNPFGEVLHGMIKISSRLVPVALEPNSDIMTSNDTENVGEKVTLYMLDGSRAVGALNLDALEVFDAPIWVLAMAEKHETEDHWTTVCLALIETGFKVGEWTEYRRVGLAGVDSFCFDDAEKTTICIV